MSSTNINNVIAVVPVKDHQNAVEWYMKLLGRDADLIPVDEVAEWQLADNAWIQVGTDAERAGYTTVIIGVNDIDVQRSFCAKAGVSVGEVVEIPEAIKMAETVDPDGNKVVFVQDISGTV
ncbi:VOC family protein [Vacuolonema iberomarrocanum]|uniref:VOC family protein n=1 Tax=Vacuolonema iberomarrocanum TaxID=3454632 RepID=UPI001A093F97|nr:VOC family protein [filamentous cyanobacterium LEGE 07170]